MLSKLKQLEVANVCYANVAGRFATFTNPAFRGPNFTWDWFITHCEENADLWMMIHHVRGNKAELRELAVKTSGQIARTLVWQATKQPS